jgi:hypothetical protein
MNHSPKEWVRQSEDDESEGASPIRPAGTIPGRNKSYAFIEGGWYGSRVIRAGLRTKAQG